MKKIVLLNTKKITITFRLKILAVIGLYTIATHLDGATFNVTNTNNAGAGSLRQAIINANNTGGTHTIQILVAGTVNINTDLPVFARNISLRGDLAPGYTVNNPVFAINAINAGWGLLFNNTAANGSQVRGLVINNAQFFNIEINGPDNIIIRDCFIGTNIAGTAATVANPLHGLFIHGNSDNITITGCTISGHGEHGILMLENSDDCVFTGNKIGCDKNGSNAIPNLIHGFVILDCQRTRIGGPNSSDRNIISGNGGGTPNIGIGIAFIQNSSDNIIQNNYIGTNSAGTAAIGNHEHGIMLLNGSNDSDIIDNVLSGNGVFGILIQDSGNEVIQGNHIGPNASGNGGIGNGSDGIQFQNSGGNLIGGTGAGDRNIISQNGSLGLGFFNSSGNTIYGNYIGTNLNGTIALPNEMSGIYASGSSNLIIGGTTVSHRNLFAASNQFYGIQLDNASSDCIIENNYIGTNASGAGNANIFGNEQNGITISNASLRTQILDNVISGNGRGFTNSGTDNGTGIFIVNDCHDQVIQGNVIGLSADGITPMPNGENGIVVLNNSNGTLIGGPNSGDRNIISSNGDLFTNIGQGIVCNNVSGIDVFNNYIGMDVNGTLNRGNEQSAIIMIFSDDFEIGRSTSGYGNVLSGNSQHGIHIVGGNGGTIHNNYIGVAADGTSPMGNQSGGIFIQGVGGGNNGSDIIIGGTGSNQSNIIAYSTGTGFPALLGNGFGIGVAHNDEGRRNTFIGNAIFCNAGLGIDLNFNGLFGGAGSNGVGNGAKTSPTITSFNPTQTQGTGNPGDIIHLYNNISCVECEGEEYLGTTTVLGNGTWTINHAAVAHPNNNSATATNTTQGTSEFSCHIALPVELLSFNVIVHQMNNSTNISWSTVSETNNDYFVLQKSKDGVNFSNLTTINGAGYSHELTNYFFADKNPFQGNNYYRLKQVDFNGRFSYSKIESAFISTEKNSISIYPNPAKNLITILQPEKDVGFTITIKNTIGQKVLYKENIIDGSQIDVSGLEKGTYFVKVTSGPQILAIKKLTIIK